MAEQRSKAEERMIRKMTRKGGKGFRVLRSPEVGIKQYQRAALAAHPTGKAETDG